MTLDESLQEFENIIGEIEVFTNTDCNESDTRSKIIDSYLFKILGWDEKDISREGHIESGFFD